MSVFLLQVFSLCGHLACFGAHLRSAPGFDARLVYSLQRSACFFVSPCMHVHMLVALFLRILLASLLPACSNTLHLRPPHPAPGAPALDHSIGLWPHPSPGAIRRLRRPALFGTWRPLPRSPYGAKPRRCLTSSKCSLLGRSHIRFSTAEPFLR